MILIITHKQDYTVDFVIKKLNEMSINYVRLNCEDLLNETYGLESRSNFEFIFKGHSTFKSVWFRRTKLPDLKGLKNEERIHVLLEFESLLKNIFATIEAKWLSDPKWVLNAENKMLQLKIAKEVGFTIPPTLLTNDKTRIKEFYFENDKNIIIKPLAYGQINYEKNPGFIFTNVVPEEVIEKIDQYDITPCIFQKNISKEYEVRITVIGKELFAAAVDSQQNEQTQNDWRREKLNFRKTVLPYEVVQKCHSILKKLNINFGAIDLIKTPSGEYVFLEINPNGQWAWIEMQTGQKISDAIINYLHNV